MDLVVKPQDKQTRNQLTPSYTDCTWLSKLDSSTYFVAYRLYMTIDVRLINLFFGWFCRAMVLGSFQCRGVLLLWHLVGQGPAVFTAGMGRVGCFFFTSILSSFSNASSLGRRLDILKYCGLGRYN